MAHQPRIDANEIFLVGLDPGWFDAYYSGSVRLLMSVVVDQEYGARRVDRLAE
jgi:hypothetical protein